MCRHFRARKLPDGHAAHSTSSRWRAMRTQHFLPGILGIHLRDVKLILYTIFWIFSSFLRMLAFTAQILSCWSLIICSSSASSTFRGSTAQSVILREHTSAHQAALILDLLLNNPQKTAQVNFYCIQRKRVPSKSLTLMTRRSKPLTSGQRLFRISATPATAKREVK